MSSGLVLLAAGGTGGHVFPAIALGRQMAERGYRMAVVTDDRGMDFPGLGDGAQRFTLPTRRLGGGVRGLARGAVSFAHAYLRSQRMMRNLKPVAAVGFGGYPSLPPILAAQRAHIPTIVHEQNAVLGRANRLLSRSAKAIALSHTPTQRLRRSAQGRDHLVGNPVRPEIAALAGDVYRVPAPDEPFRLLVVGGSQGAHIFAELLPAAIGHLADGPRARLAITQQCRPEDLERVRAAYGRLGLAPEISVFFEDIPARMAAANLIICRAGASTVAEITTIGRPAVYIPYPHATDDHQRANAEAVERAGGGWLLPEDRAEPKQLAQRLEYALAEPGSLEATALAAAKLGHANAASRLADLVEASIQMGETVGVAAHHDQGGGSAPHNLDRQFRGTAA